MQVKPFAEPIGAEITGLRPGALQDPDTIGELRQALHQHLVVVVRDHDLGIEGQVDLTRLFGQPELAWDRRSRHPDNPHIQVMNSAPRPVSAPASSSQFWHTDGSFLPAPPSTTLLAIQQLPVSGGDTLFVDTRSAYESLDASARSCLRDLELIFSYRYRLYGLQTMKYGGDDGGELEDHPDVRHPLVRHHPATKRAALYLDQLCASGVAGMAPADSTELLERLYAHTLVPERQYQHIWRQSDMLIWDNPSLMHRRGTNHEGPRLLYRTTAAGPRPVHA
ncbi:MAG TPA: TauD/TfdA family dioxygenase [Streptosporangiaceae bacterium]|nr:TauD/TfdA family dioxygenase [Streptosporangiaceae bacterium]